MRLQFLVKNPYFGSDDNKWRPYVNYLSGGGPPGAPFTWEDWYGTVGEVNDQVWTLHAL